jgi:hypothetical protein
MKAALGSKPKKKSPRQNEGGLLTQNAQVRGGRFARVPLGRGTWLVPIPKSN